VCDIRLIIGREVGGPVWGLVILIQSPRECSIPLLEAALLSFVTIPARLRGRRPTPVLIQYLERTSRFVVSIAGLDVAFALVR
jgi:hypothetical protein